MADECLLENYRNILRTGLDAGYRFISFADIGKEDAARTCLLRHDIDSELLGCSPMLDIERDLGVRATYFLMTRSTAYNLFSVEARAVVSRMIADGHQIGLHFMGETCEGDDGAALCEKILRERHWLAEEFGADLHAVSFHQPTRAILDADLFVPGLVNTYNRQQMGPYFYLADTNMQWRSGHPADLFRAGTHARMQLLIHPMWWTAEPTDVRGKWTAVLERNRAAVIDHWKARERTLATVNLD